jgi:hypothetical protein
MAVPLRDLHFTLHKISNDSETGKSTLCCKREKKGEKLICHVVTPQGSKCEDKTHIRERN